MPVFIIAFIAAGAALVTWRIIRGRRAPVDNMNEEELDLALSEDVGDVLAGSGTQSLVIEPDSEVIVSSEEGENLTPVDPTGGDILHRKVYPPFSEAARALFREAARVAGLPLEWADSKGLHEILGKESSGGRVGVPNYTYGARARDPARWPEIWEELRQGKLTGDPVGPDKGVPGHLKSSATGLGQLTLTNILGAKRRDGSREPSLYPDGANGIGDPLNEAIGMLRYIKNRYGDPDTAWARYGKKHEGY